MAKDTRLNLRNEIIYCIYVRNHTPEGTFAAIIPSSAKDPGAGRGHHLVHADPSHRRNEAQRGGRQSLRHQRTTALSILPTERWTTSKNWPPLSTIWA